MKNYILFICTIILWLTAPFASKSQDIFVFDVTSPVVSGGKIVINNASIPTSITFNVVATTPRDIATDGPFDSKMVITLVYEKNGIIEDISNPIDIPNNKFSSGYLKTDVLTFSGTLPANKVGGVIKLKYSCFDYVLSPTTKQTKYTTSSVMVTEPVGIVVGTPPPFTAPVSGAVPLYEYASGNKRVLTTTYFSSYFDFVYKGVLGFVFTSAAPGTVPLYRYFQSSNENRYYTINKGTYGGYIGGDTVCYVYPNQITKTRPIYEHYGVVAGKGFHRYTNEPGSFEGWENVDVKFYVLQNKQSTTYPLPEDDCAELYEYYSNSYQDHYYTTVRTPDSDVYYYSRVLAYVYTIQKTGTVPLYRYWNPSIQDHYYTTAKQNYGNYFYEGITGYVYPSSGVSGTVGIYEHYSGSATNHYYNNVYSDHSPTYNNEGIKFYMLQYSH